MPIVNGAYDAPTWNNNAPPAIDASELQDMCDTIETYGTQKADVDYVNTFVRPNLLDNWYFAGGGSQQNDGRFPINQKKKTYYNTSGYSIDRWYNRSGSDVSISLDTTGITLEVETGASSNKNMFVSQRLENYRGILGKTVTISALVDLFAFDAGGARIGISSSDSVGLNTTTLGQAYITGTGLFQATFTLPSTISHSGLNVHLLCEDSSPQNSYIRIAACKLELGSSQTLAHLNNGSWVLNEIPSFEEQLAKCQRHQIELNLYGWQYTMLGVGAGYSSTRANVEVVLPTTMRARPTLTTNGTFTVTNFSSSATPTSFNLYRFGGSRFTLECNVASGLTQGAVYVLQNTAATDSFFLDANL